eukprot:6208720-Pleurochrysis_carterae.AAC.2
MKWAFVVCFVARKKGNGRFSSTLPSTERGGGEIRVEGVDVKREASEERGRGDGPRRGASDTSARACVRAPLSCFCLFFCRAVWCVLVLVGVGVGVDVVVGVSSPVGARETRREGERGAMRATECVCVCVRERERERGEGEVRSPSSSRDALLFCQAPAADISTRSPSRAAYY